MSYLSLTELIDLIIVDPQLVANGERRMEDVWCGRVTDSLPIHFYANGPENVQYVSDNVRQYQEDEVMLYNWACSLVAAARSGSDMPLTIRANTGTGTLATIAGCTMMPIATSLPWTNPITREEIEAFDPTADFSTRGIMPRVKNLYSYYREHLPTSVNYFIADTQGPFDLAHLLYGDELFYAIYDEPEFVHELMAKATTLYIRGSELMKSWIGEPLDGGYHWNLKMANGGVRCCEDTSTLLNGDSIAEFVAPYQQQALAVFGGGYVHFCGNNPALYRAVLENPYARGLNFGNPELFDFAVVLPELIAAGKCYQGGIPRNEGESLRDYFTRVISYTAGSRTGLIFMPSLWPAELNEPERVVGLWRELQR